MRWIKTILAGRRRTEQAMPLSSLAARVVSSTLQASASPIHPLRVLAESYFIASAGNARYYVDTQRGAQYDHPLVAQLSSSISAIARAYIVTGAVLLRRRIDDTLDVVAWNRVQVSQTQSADTRLVSVDNSLLVPNTYAIVTWGERTIDDVVPPWSVLALELALDASSREYAASVLYTDAYMRRIIIPQEPIVNPRDAQELRDSLNAIYSRNKGATAVLPIPASVHESAPAIGDMRLGELAESVEARVAAVYGIPINLLGLQASASHQTYANREQAARDYVVRTLLPFWQRVARAVSQVWDVSVEVDVESIPELQEDVVESTVRLFTSGIITLEEARERLGYDVTTITARDDLQQDTDDDMLQLASDEMYYQGMQSRYDAVSRALQSAFGDALDTVVSKTSTMHDAERRVYLYSSEYQEDLRAPILRRLKAEIDATINDAYNEARRSADAYVQDPLALARKESDAIIRELTDDAMRYTGETVRTRLLEGASELLSASYVALVANTLATAIVTRLQLATWRAMQTASRKPLKLRKVWLSMRDGKVRTHHQEMDGIGVDVGAKFAVPGKHGTEYADGPGDPALSAENRINCRCVLRPRRLR